MFDNLDMWKHVYSTALAMNAFIDCWALKAKSVTLSGKLQILYLKYRVSMEAD